MSNGKKVVGVNLPEDIEKEIRGLASKEHRSFSSEVAYLLEQGLKAHAIKQAAIADSQIDVEALGA